MKIENLQTHKKVLRLITEIRESHSQMENIFLHGSCFNLFKILKTVFPEAKAWEDGNHFITEISGRFYDITGEVKKERHLPLKDAYPQRRIPMVIKSMKFEEYKITQI